MENFDRLSYDPDTGIFTWVKSKWKKNIGTQAGYTNQGRIAIFYDKKRYFAHRLAWFFYYGEWPKNQIDHINGNSSDNRIANLRDVTGVVNMQNIRKPRKDGSSGFLGVTWNKQAKKWKSQIRVNGKKEYLGYFCSPEKAYDAYLKAKRKHHDGCTI